MSKEEDIKLWRLGPDRVEEWRDIRLEALRNAPEAFDSTYTDWKTRPLGDFAARLEQVATFAAGREIGSPLAVAGWQAELDPRDLERAWLLSVYSRDEVRGQGFARAVCRAVIDDAVAAGMTSIGLNVLATNLTAQRFYRRLGFEVTRREGVSNSQGFPEFEMMIVNLSSSGG